MREARQKSARNVGEQETLKARIEEVERLLLAAVESSCSKESMTGSMKMLQVCRSVLQCVAVCCGVLQCVAKESMTGSMKVLQCVAVCCCILQCAAVCCSNLQCVDVCCSALQCVAVCCSVLQCVAVCCREFVLQRAYDGLYENAADVFQCVAVCCGVLQCVAMCCGALHKRVSWAL